MAGQKRNKITNSDFTSYDVIVKSHAICVLESHGKLQTARKVFLKAHSLVFTNRRMA